MLRKMLLLALLILCSWALAQAEVVETPGGDKSLLSLPDAIPVPHSRLSNIMRENGYRLANTYWAVNGGNWGLAQYQLQALHEAMADAKQISPQSKQMLDTFEQSYREPLSIAIQNENVSQFNRQFALMVDGCNACHVAVGRGFIRYQLPEASGSGALLDFSVPSKPGSSSENNTPATPQNLSK